MTHSTEHTTSGEIAASGQRARDVTPGSLGRSIRREVQKQHEAAKIIRTTLLNAFDTSNSTAFREAAVPFAEFMANNAHEMSDEQLTGVSQVIERLAVHQVGRAADAALRLLPKFTYSTLRRKYTDALQDFLWETPIDHWVEDTTFRDAARLEPQLRAAVNAQLARRSILNLPLASLRLKWTTRPSKLNIVPKTDAEIKLITEVFRLTAMTTITKDEHRDEIDVVGGQRRGGELAGLGKNFERLSFRERAGILAEPKRLKSLAFELGLTGDPNASSLHDGGSFDFVTSVATSCSTHRKSMADALATFNSPNVPEARDVAIAIRRDDVLPLPGSTGGQLHTPELA